MFHKKWMKKASFHMECIPIIGQIQTIFSYSEDKNANTSICMKQYEYATMNRIAIFFLSKYNAIGLTGCTIIWNRMWGDVDIPYVKHQPGDPILQKMQN